MRQGDGAVLDELAADVEAGYPTFVRHHAAAVYTTVLRLSGSRAEAEDISQETFVRAYQALRRYDPDRIRALQARGWLAAIAVNLWRNSLRTASRRPRPASRRTGAGLSDIDVPDPAPGPEAAVEANEASALLASLLARLPEHHRVPVVLRHVVGLSYAEVATALECPVGTAKANVARGVKALQVMAAKENTSQKNKEQS